ncbi:hypothetical protein I5F72_12220, partial [Pseudomonas aeruginosa]|nr:hypothetical protein [Pseudomonas aeruginosa]
NLAELLDLVALGSVADVVPLDANNRILVHQGLGAPPPPPPPPGGPAGADIKRLSVHDRLDMGRTTERVPG